MSNVKLKWYGDKAKSVAQEAAYDALMKEAMDLQGKSAQQAPVDTGDLRANCSISSPLSENTDTKRTVDVGYDLPYAVVQHEHLEYRHPKGGKAKYLENPFNANKSKYENFIKNAVKKALKAR